FKYNEKLRGSQESCANAVNLTASERVPIFNRASCGPSQMSGSAILPVELYIANFRAKNNDIGQKTDYF
ncbi:MAG: hypothetical protein KAR13_03640, partial [Desulfobulbaceae bacterium]|nr:hypothetical protein [Desulfobulbaceae bacterium]